MFPRLAAIGWKSVLDALDLYLDQPSRTFWWIAIAISIADPGR
jgi:hypothetical protein